MAKKKRTPCPTARSRRASSETFAALRRARGRRSGAPRRRARGAPRGRLAASERRPPAERALVCEPRGASSVRRRRCAGASPRAEASIKASRARSPRCFQILAVHDEAPHRSQPGAVSSRRARRAQALDSIARARAGASAPCHGAPQHGGGVRVTHLVSGRKARRPLGSAPKRQNALPHALDRLAARQVAERVVPARPVRSPIPAAPSSSSPWSARAGARARRSADVVARPDAVESPRASRAPESKLSPSRIIAMKTSCTTSSATASDPLCKRSGRRRLPPPVGVVTPPRLRPTSAQLAPRRWGSSALVSFSVVGPGATGRHFCFALGGGKVPENLRESEDLFGLLHERARVAPEPPA